MVELEEGVTRVAGEGIDGSCRRCSRNRQDGKVIKQKSRTSFQIVCLGIFMVVSFAFSKLMVCVRAA
jgi:hypothetical protein